MNSLSPSAAFDHMPTLSADAIRKIFCKFVNLGDLNEACRALAQSRIGGYEMMDKEGIVILYEAFKASPYLERHYGPATQLCMNLKRFADFPGRHHYFGCKISEPYGHTAVRLISMSGKSYIYRHDLFMAVQNFILSKHIFMLTEIARTVLIINLKYRESYCAGSFEIIPYDNSVLEELQAAVHERILDEKISNMLKDPDEYNLNSKKLNESNILWHFKKLIPKIDDPQIMETLSRVTGMFYSLHMSRELKANFMLVYAKIKTLLNTTLEWMDSRPDLFMPYTKTNPHPQPRVVRMFIETDRRYVFHQEIQRALNRTSFEEDPCTEDTSCQFMQVNTTFLKYMNILDFIPVFIKDMRYRQQPFPGPNYKFVKFAGDVFFEEVVPHVFDIMKVMSLEEADKLFTYIESFFALEDTNITLIPCAKIPLFLIQFHEKISQATKKFYKGKIPPLDQREIHNFSREFLEEELSQYNLSKAFPQLKSYADLAYYLAMQQNEGVLKAGHFQKILNILKLQFLAHYRPHIGTFLHNQRVCLILDGIRCPHCSAEDYEKGKSHYQEDYFMDAINEHCKIKMPGQDNIPRIPYGNAPTVSRQGYFQLITKYHMLEGTDFLKDAFEKLGYTGDCDLDYADDNGFAMFPPLIDFIGRIMGQTSRELFAELNMFNDFPKSYALMDYEPYEPFNSDVNLLATSTGELYIYKHDLYILMQNMIYYNLPDCKFRVFYYIVRLRFGILITHLNNTCEFLKYESNILDWFQTMLTEFAEKTQQTTLEETDSDPILLTPEQVFQWFKEYVEEDQPEEYYMPLRKFSDEFYDYHVKYGMKSMLNAKQRFQSQLTYIAGGFQMENPKMFEPYGPDNPSDIPTICRVFVDLESGNSYVSHQEYAQALMPPGTFKLNPSKMNLMKKVDAEFLKNSSKEITFIYAPIDRTPHRAIPMLMIDGNHRITGTDALLEVLHYYVECCRTFYKVTQEEAIQLLDDISQSFPSKEKEKLFYPCELVKQICDSITIDGKKPLNVQEDQRKTIFDDFTVDQLNEAVYLGGLPDVFPMALSLVDVVYKNMKQRRGYLALNDADFSVALENLQLLCIFEMKPPLLEFIHNQGDCTRLRWLHCRHCKGSRKVLDLEQIQRLFDDPENSELWEQLEGNKRVKPMKEGDAFQGLISTDSSPPPKSIVIESKRKEKKAAKKAARAARAQIAAQNAENVAREARAIEGIPEERTKKIESDQNDEENREEEEKSEEPMSSRGTSRAASCERKKMSITSSNSSSALPPPPKPTKEESQKQSNTCQKCIRTSNRCMKVTKDYEEAMKKIQSIEKELRCTKKDMTAMSDAFHEMTKTGEEKSDLMKNLLEQRDEMTKRFNREIQRAQRSERSMQLQLEKKNKLNKQLLNQLAQKIEEKGAVVEMPEETRLLLEELEEKSAELFVHNNHILDMANRAAYLLEIDPVRMDGPGEFLTYRVEFNLYKDAVELNIAAIKANPKVTPEDLVPLPHWPDLSEKFKEMYAEALEEEEGRKCSVCLKSLCRPMEKPGKKIARDDLAKAEWINRNSTCFTCRRTEDRITRRAREELTEEELEQKLEEQ